MILGRCIFIFLVLFAILQNGHASAKAAVPERDINPCILLLEEAGPLQYASDWFPGNIKGPNFLKQYSELRNNANQHDWWRDLLKSTDRIVDKEIFGLYYFTDHLAEKENYPDEVRRLLVKEGEDKITEIRDDETLAKSLISKQSVPVPSSLGKIIDILHQDESFSFITVNMAPLSTHEFSPLTRKLQGLFFRLNIQLSQRAYRAKSLVPNEVDSPIKLLTDWNFSPSSGEMPHKLVLMYDTNIWNSFLLRINEVIEPLEHINPNEAFLNIDDSKPRVGRAPNDPLWHTFEPLFPEMGISTFKNINTNKTYNFSFRRLFLNDNSDPLNLLPQKTKVTRLAVLNFYLKVANSLPPGSLLEAEAHTTIHYRLYRSYGFDLKSRTIDKNWNNIEVFTLVGIRENVIKKISELISLENNKN